MFSRVFHGRHSAASARDLFACECLLSLWLISYGITGLTPNPSVLYQIMDYLGDPLLLGYALLTAGALCLVAALCGRPGVRTLAFSIQSAVWWLVIYGAYQLNIGLPLVVSAIFSSAFSLLCVLEAGNNDRTERKCSGG